MQTVHLPYAIAFNGSLVSWRASADEIPNDIQKLITRYDLKNLECGNHSYLFNHLPNHKANAIPFSFHETNLLMQLMPAESHSFYLKAALREYMNTFTVFNSKGDRVYPEDIV